LWMGTDPDPDPTFYLNVDPDAWSQTNAESGSWSDFTVNSQKVAFLKGRKPAPGS